MGWKRLEYDSYRLDRERASATTAGALSLQEACTLSARRYDVIENEKQSKINGAAFDGDYSSSGISPEKLNMSSRGIEAPSTMPTTRATSSTY